MKKYFLLILFLGLNHCFAQNKLIDSLKQNLITLPEDSNKVNTLNFLSKQFENAGDQNAALDHSNNAITLAEKIQFKKGLATALKSNGNIYFKQSNFPKALEYYLYALKVFEEIGDKQGIGRCYGSIANVYQNQADYPKALDYYLQALTKFEEMGNKQVIGITYNNIGEAYRHQSNYPKALEYYFKGLKVSVDIGDKHGMGNCYNNIGIVYKDKSDFSNAKEYYFKALKLRGEINDRQGMGATYNNLCELSTEMSDFKSAVNFCDSALKINKETNDLNLLRKSHQNASRMYVKTNSYKDAYLNYVQFKQLTDSIFSTANSKKLGDLRTAFEVEKKEAELKLKAEAQQAIADQEKKKQQFVIYLGALMLIFVLVFAGFMFNRYKITKKQKIIIEKQKELVEESQKHTIDSIKYAKRIQQALLTPEKYMSNYIRDFFIIYKPKDIVSGDFYSAIYIRNKFYLATADCTGHGVPGGFMSMLGISFLNEIIIEKGVESPDKILNQLRVEIVNALNPEGSNEESSDGMDISLLCLDLVNNTLEFAAANNAVYIIRDKEIIKLKPDKMPVGKHIGEIKPFISQHIKLQANDLIYTFTDGYADQFGGPKGKKYNYKQFEDALQLNSLRTLKEQKELLLKNIEDWKGNLEQVDDVTVIGIKI